jgi:hypothetical protein
VRAGTCEKLTVSQRVHGGRLKRPFLVARQAMHTFGTFSSLPRGHGCGLGHRGGAVVFFGKVTVE